MTPIQTNISGYAGKPCSLFSVYDTDKKILAISKEAAYNNQRQKDCVLISNDKTADYDVLFTELNFANSLDDFFVLSNGVAQDGRSQRLVFSEKAARANPKNSIEKDGYNENGQKYSIAPTITNLQMAVLATCYYANSKAGAIENALAMFEQLNEIDYFATLKSGGIVTI